MSHAPELIERIRASTDIVALIGRQVPLRRSGRNHMGRCPFHQERTPSFSVNAEKGMFYCFGCHKGGDVFAWTMQMQGLEFGDAVRHLAHAAGIELADTSPAQKAQLAAQERQAALVQALNQKLVQALWGPHGAQARRMLEQRRVPAKEARLWQLGYASDAEALCSQVIKDGFTETELHNAGLLAEDRQPPRLLFHQRLTFPIADMSGRLVGFGGRVLGAGSSSGPKYLNSRDSELFHKRGQLFGLHRAQKAIRTSRQVVLVEGFMDVLAAHRAGMEQAVAALGTALTVDHAVVCKKLADEAVLMLDGDSAGERAAAKAALTLLQAGLRVQIAWLPQGQDPASVVQDGGTQKLSALLEASRPAVEALMVRAFAHAPESIEGRVVAARGLMPIIDAMGESLERELYVGRLASQVGVPVESLMAHWYKPKHKAQNQPSPQRGSGPQSEPQRARAQAPAAGDAQADAGARPPANQDAKAAQAAAEAVRASAMHEWTMVQELLLFAELRNKLDVLTEYVETPQVRDFLEAVSAAQEPDVDALKVLIERWVPDPAWRKRLSMVAPLSQTSLDGGPTRANRTFEDILRRLKWRHVDVALKRVLRQLRETERRGDATEELLRRKQELTARKRTLIGVSK